MHMTDTPVKRTPLPYKLEVTIGEKTYKASGKTMYGALKKIKPKDYSKSGGYIKTFVRGKEGGLPLKMPAIKLEQIFEKPVNLELFAKRIEAIL
jgi:hypothetical protein